MVVHFNLCKNCTTTTMKHNICMNIKTHSHRSHYYHIIWDYSQRKQMLSVGRSDTLCTYFTLHTLWPVFSFDYWHSENYCSKCTTDIAIILVFYKQSVLKEEKCLYFFQLLKAACLYKLLNLFCNLFSYSFLKHKLKRK